MGDAFSSAYDFLKALNPSPHHMDEGLDEEQMRHFGNMQQMQARYGNPPIPPHKTQPQPIDRTNPRGLYDPNMIQPSPTMEEKPIVKAWQVLKYNTNIVPGAHIGQAQERMMNEGSWDEQGNFSFPPQGLPDPSQNPHNMRQALGATPGNMGQRSHEKIDQFREQPAYQFVDIAGGAPNNPIRGYTISVDGSKDPIVPDSKTFPTNFSTARSKKNRYSPDFEQSDAYFTQPDGPHELLTRDKGDWTDKELSDHHKALRRLPSHEKRNLFDQAKWQPHPEDTHYGQGRDRSDPAF